MRKQEIAEWVSEVYLRAQKYADALDPKVEHNNPIANRLDAIANNANMIYHNITGRLVND